MAGKFNKKVKYRKKNFNIYKKIIPNHNCKLQHYDPKINKLKFDDLPYRLKQKYQQDQSPGILDKLFKMFGL